MKPLFIPLNTEYFRAFQSGEKTCEWRIYGARWNEKTCRPGRAVTLSHGYGKAERLTGVVVELTKHQIEDPNHIFNRVFGEKARGATAACIRVDVRRGGAHA